MSRLQQDRLESPYIQAIREQDRLEAKIVELNHVMSPYIQAIREQEQLHVLSSHDPWLYFNDVEAAKQMVESEELKLYNYLVNENMFNNDKEYISIFFNKALQGIKGTVTFDGDRIDIKRFIIFKIKQMREKFNMTFQMNF